MFKPTLSRRGTARTLSTLLALTLAVGVGGLSANAASAGVAETPQGVTAVSTTQADNSGNVVVNWTPLADSASVSNIHVTLAGQADPLDIPSDYPDGAAFSGATPGVHTASVVFQYADSSPDSAAVTKDVTVDPVGTPIAVSDIHGTSNGTDVTVLWTSAVDQDPDAPGAPYDHYTVTLGTEPPVDVPAGLSDTMFTGIAPGSYAIEVDAVNALHSTQAFGSFVVTGATVPDAPLSVTATNTANTSIGVVWEAPASDGGNPITDYEVVLTFPHGDVDGDGNVPTWTAADPASGDKRDAGFAEMPLDQGPYVVTVRALNASGYGPATSTPEQTMMPSTVPDAPTDVSAISPEGNTAIVSWTAPVVDGGQPIEEYDITLGDDTLSTDGTGRVVQFQDVAAGTYDVAVTAINSNGASEAGTATVTIADESTQPAGAAPGAPTHLHATKVKKGGVTTIKWRAPKVGEDGMPVIIYILLVDGRVTFAPGDETKLKVKGLRAGPAKIKMIALNENGFSKITKIKIHVAKAVAQAPKRTLRLGMTGAAVKRLQKHIGMRHPSGTFGKATRHRIMQYQRWTGKKRTGEVNDRLRYLLDV